MKKDVSAYMRYYNTQRLHTANGDETPIDFERVFYRGAAGRSGFCVADTGSAMAGSAQQAKRVSA